MAALTNRQSKMTQKERDLQEQIFNKYRRSGILPTILETRKKTGVSSSTITAFMAGCSANETLRAYYKDRLTKNLEPLPKEVVTLFAVWENDKD